MPNMDLVGKSIRTRVMICRVVKMKISIVLQSTSYSRISIRMYSAPGLTGVRQRSPRVVMQSLRKPSLGMSHVRPQPNRSGVDRTPVPVPVRATSKSLLTEDGTRDLIGHNPRESPFIGG